MLIAPIAKVCNAWLNRRKPTFRFPPISANAVVLLRRQEPSSAGGTGFLPAQEHVALLQRVHSHPSPPQRPLSPATPEYPLPARKGRR